MEVLIRQAEIDDLGSLTALFVASALSNGDDREALQANPEALEFSPLAVQDGRTWVATTLDGCIVGFCSILAMADAVKVEDLFVDPGWQRRGVGRELILHVVARARQAGATHVAVTSNKQARPFYEKAGFAFDGDVETCIGPAAAMLLVLRDLPGDHDA